MTHCIVDKDLNKLQKYFENFTDKRWCWERYITNSKCPTNRINYEQIKYLGFYEVFYSKYSPTVGNHFMIFSYSGLI